MRLGLDRGLGLARRGGLFSLFPANEMQLGMGLAGISSYSGYYPFSNVLWNADKWQRQSGSGAFTQSFGTLAAATSTDVFYCKFAEGDAAANLPAGTYTVLNPDGCKIGVGWGGTPSATGWQTATSFTFTKPAGAVIALWAEGSVTNSIGPIRIITPGQLSAFNSGDYWNPDFISFLAGLNVKALRFMDWLSAYKNTMVNWADNHTANAITFMSKYGQLYTQIVPHDLIVNLCNRLAINPWVNVPVRASADYMDGLATYYAANLNAARKIYFEFGNETWNFGGPFNDARVWTELYTHTRYKADSNVGISGWTKTAHGLSNGDIVSQFFTDENHLTTSDTQVYPLGYGVGLYVEVVDANNFKLYEDVARTVLVPSTANTPKLLYSLRTEAGKTVSVDTNTGIASKAMWDRMDAILGRGRCYHVLGTQYVSATGTTARLAPTGVRAATDLVAVAPYFSGDWFVGCMDIASGQLTPKAWQKVAGTMRCAVYAAGSTPTITDVANGTGTGYIAHRDIVIASDERTSYTTGTAITGLTNGTTYEVRFVMTGIFNDKWMASGTATVSATPSTVSYTDSNANMAARSRRGFTSTQAASMPAQIAAASPIPVACYEAGTDFFANNLTLAEVVAWRTSYTQSVEAGDAFRRFYRGLASYGLRVSNQFVDINVTPGVFNLAESFTDTADYRYQQFSAFNGIISSSTRVAISNVTASPISVEPAYPATAYTFDNGALTYSIYSGNNSGNFVIVGTQLRLVNGTGINWGALNNVSLVIEASDGNTSTYFTVSMELGTLVAGGVAAPALTGSPTLLASWDFANDSTITNVSGRVSAISGADGTSYSLAGPGGTANPTITTAGGKQVAAFASASSQKLDGAHTSGITGACTMVLIMKADSTTTAGLLEAARGTNASNFDRLALLMSSSTGFQSRQHDAAGTQCVASVGSVPNTTDTQLVIGVMPNATSTTTSLNVNGQGTAIAGTPSAGAATGLATTTIGSRRLNGTNDLYANIKVFRALIYNGALTTTQREEIATWAATNYSTANNA